MEWDVIIEEIGPCLKRFFALHFDGQTAADLTQETLIRLVQKVRSREYIPARANLKTYSYGLARMVKLETFRKLKYDSDKKSKWKELQNLSDEGITIDQKSSQMDLKKAIFQLNEREQEVCSLMLDKDLPLVEIAKILNLPIGTVKSHMHRARKNLKQLLAS